VPEVLCNISKIFILGKVAFKPASFKFLLVLSLITFILSQMKKLLIIIISLLIYSCSNTEIYRVTITQGTVFTQEDLDKLEIGMTKDQVSFVMGQPSFENFFEKNVWNYIYKVTTGDEIDVEKKVKLIFDEENLLSEVVIIKI
jgi:outer membrane protein assembly factor BamE